MLMTVALWGGLLFWPIGMALAFDGRQGANPWARDQAPLPGFPALDYDPAAATPQTRRDQVPTPSAEAVFPPRGYLPGGPGATVAPSRALDPRFVVPEPEAVRPHERHPLDYANPYGLSGLPLMPYPGIYPGYGVPQWGAANHQRPIVIHSWNFYGAPQHNPWQTLNPYSSAAGLGGYPWTLGNPQNLNQLNALLGIPTSQTWGASPWMATPFSSAPFGSFGGFPLSLY